MAIFNDKKILLGALKGDKGEKGSTIHFGNELSPNTSGWLSDDVYINNATKDYFLYDGEKLILQGNIGKFDETLTAEITCDHSIEVTGNTGDEHGLEIDDQQVLISKIEGQTKPKSPNLLNVKDNTTTVNGVTFTAKNGIITANGTATDTAFYFLESGTNEFRSKILNRKLTIYGSPKTATNSTHFIGMFNLSGTGRVDRLNGDTALTFTFTNENASYNFAIGVLQGETVNNVVFKPMLVYGDERLPFEKYDNTLVNSKNDIISTGRNLFNKEKATDGKAIGSIGNVYADATRFITDYITVLPNETYYISNLNGNGWVNFYDKAKNLLGVYDKADTFKTPQDSFYMVVSQKLIYKDTQLICYGNDGKYEPYKQDKYVCGIELGANDYIDTETNKTYKYSSGIITLDGSSDESYALQGTTEKLYIAMTVGNIDHSKRVLNNGDWGSTDTNNLAWKKIATADTRILFGLTGGTITTVEEWRKYLASNPLQIAYTKTTPTITENNALNGYAVYRGGQQIQDGELPYIINKKYSLTMKSQILANIEIDREQQENIYNIKSGIAEVEARTTTAENDITTLKEKVGTLGAGITVYYATLSGTTVTFTTTPTKTNFKDSFIELSEGDYIYRGYCYRYYSIDESVNQMQEIYDFKLEGKGIITVTYTYRTQSFSATFKAV